MKLTDRISKYEIFLVIISLVVAILIHYPELISLSDEVRDATLFPKMRWIDVVNEIAFTFISLLILFGANLLIFKFDWPLVQITWWKLLLSFVFVLIGSNLLGQLFVFFHKHFNIPAIDSMVHHYLHPLRDFIMSSIVVGGCYITYLMRKSRSMVLENQQLRTENVLNQYEALKSQLNPHMLFNSLNTLRSLIRETPDKAQDYLQELSRVLRYTLNENDTKSVTLREEMDFVEAYMYLLKMRYEDNLIFDITVDEESENRVLPPMSVQLLLENAVKHNEISNRRPLVISLKTAKDSLIVSNKKQPKLTSTGGTRIGLANLAKRYGLLFKKDILIQDDNGYFKVTLPLI